MDPLEDYACSCSPSIFQTFLSNLRKGGWVRWYENLKRRPPGCYSEFPAQSSGRFR